jgi:ABC-type polysaccharide/polyol phosphate export permease
MREYMLMPHTADTMLVATRLFRRDLDKDFSSALFGYLWNFADPLVIAGVFIVLQSGGVIAIKDEILPFASRTVTEVVDGLLNEMNVSAP